METIAGIVSEYNPFHNGHVYHIEKTRESLGNCGIVCVMSGNYVQRGEPAILIKHARAEAAVLCGADLVLELPAPYALSSAETFGRRAVQILAATGIVTHLSFGSECGDTELLKAAADVLLGEEFKIKLRPLLNRGLPFAKARAEAAGAVRPEIRALFDSPNNNLGIEYIKAIHSAGYPIVPLTVRREGAAHDSPDAAGRFASASLLREIIGDGGDVSAYLPEKSLGILRREILAGKAPVTEIPSMLSYLVRMEPQKIAEVPDCGEGLEYRIHAALRASSDIKNMLSAAKTKRYAHARLKRIAMCAFLGIDAAMVSEGPHYLRVLACGAHGQEILRRMKKTAALPVIIRPGQAKKMLGGGALAMFEAECTADDQYGLAMPRPQKCGSGWRSTPYVQKLPNGQ